MRFFLKGGGRTEKKEGEEEKEKEERQEGRRKEGGRKRLQGAVTKTMTKDQ